MPKEEMKDMREENNEMFKTFLLSHYKRLLDRLSHLAAAPLYTHITPGYD